MADISTIDREAGRLVLSREGLIEAAPEALAEEGWSEFELLSTERALGGAPRLREAATRVHQVAPGPVPDASAAVLDQVESERLVALGGGRVIDAAKAIAAVRGGEVAAVPTTLSGAPITAIHRLPAGHEGRSGVRPALVLADPEAMTDLPEPELRATAMNALAHGADALYTPLADETSRELSQTGARLIANALDQDPEERDRSGLAEGALLTARAVDRAGIALHHVLGQTTVRVCGTPHAETYAALLPLTMEEMGRRAPEQTAALAHALGVEAGAIRRRIEELAGGRRRLSELGAERECFEATLDEAMARGELEHMTPGEVTREDLARVLEEAW